jgi:hypothetical protein
VRIGHVLSHRVSVHVHRGTDVSMTHQPLLHTYRSSYRIKPSTEDVTKVCVLTLPILAALAAFWYTRQI